MSSEGWTVIGVTAAVLLGLGAIALTLRRRNASGALRSKASLRGPFGTNLDVEASNEVAPGVRVQDATTHEGGLTAADNTGRGVDVARVSAQKDITLSNNPPSPKV
jgi:hypothetical protein